MKMKTTTFMMPLLLAACFLMGTTALRAEEKREERKVSGFSEISISIAADVYLSQGDEEKLILEGDEDDLEKTETEVRGNRLIIKQQNTSFFGGTKKIKVYITVREINEINIAGSAKLKAETAIRSGKMKFNISGSGKIRIPELETKEISAGISGSGDMILAGSKSVDEMDLSISGSGDLVSKELEVGEAKINVSGSGGCEVYVTKRLEVSISGSGTVYYKGSPVINAKVSGSGKVREAN